MSSLNLGAVRGGRYVRYEGKEGSQGRHAREKPVRVVRRTFLEQVNCSPMRSEDDHWLPAGVEVHDLSYGSMSEELNTKPNMGHTVFHINVAEC